MVESKFTQSQGRYMVMRAWLAGKPIKTRLFTYLHCPKRLQPGGIRLKHDSRSAWSMLAFFIYDATDCGRLTMSIGLTVEFQIRMIGAMKKAPVGHLRRRASSEQMPNCSTLCILAESEYSRQSSRDRSSRT